MLLHLEHFYLFFLSILQPSLHQIFDQGIQNHTPTYAEHSSNHDADHLETLNFFTHVINKLTATIITTVASCI